MLGDGGGGGGQGQGQGQGGWLWEPAGVQGAMEVLPPGQQVSLAVLSPSLCSTPSVLLRKLV